MTTKKYKTVAGYLRSCGESLSYRKMPEDRDQHIAAVRAGQRDIINNLLPQIGITGRIEAAEKPSDGVERLLAMGGTAQQVSALEACRRWLKNYVIILSVSAIPQVKTAEGLVSYEVNGFRRGDTKSRVSMIVDQDPANSAIRSPHAIAEEIAGPEYCFHACSNINHWVPDSAKNRLFTSDEELYTAVPQLRPHQSRRSAR
jgi:hypothetical protein